MGCLVTLLIQLKLSTLFNNALLSKIGVASRFEPVLPTTPKESGYWARFESPTSFNWYKLCGNWDLSYG